MPSEFGSQTLGDYKFKSNNDSLALNVFAKHNEKKL